MIRLLGQNEYGLYNIAASTISYLGILNLALVVLIFAFTLDIK